MAEVRLQAGPSSHYFHQVEALGAPSSLCRPEKWRKAQENLHSRHSVLEKLFDEQRAKLVGYLAEPETSELQRKQAITEVQMDYLKDELRKVEREIETMAEAHLQASLKFFFLCSMITRPEKWRKAEENLVYLCHLPPEAEPPFPFTLAHPAFAKIVDSHASKCEQISLERLAINNQLRTNFLPSKFFIQSPQPYHQLQMQNQQQQQQLMLQVQHAQANMGSSGSSLFGDFDPRRWKMMPNRNVMTGKDGQPGNAMQSVGSPVQAVSQMLRNDEFLIKALSHHSDPQEVFDKLPTRDASSWNALIIGYCNLGHYERALERFEQMKCKDQKDKLWPMASKLGIGLKGNEKELREKAFMKQLMQTWLPASDALLEMMVFHLPSPANAQRGLPYGWAEDVPCGNTVAMVDLDQYITKNATLTSEKETDAHPIRAMGFFVLLVVLVAVQCKVASDLPKLVEGLKCLAKSDLTVVCTIEKSGEHIITGAGELHLEICLKDLQEDFMGGAEIVVSNPVVSFKEIVLEKASLGPFWEFEEFIIMVAKTKIELKERHARVSQYNIMRGMPLIRLHGSMATIEARRNTELIAKGHNNWFNLMKEGLRGGKHDKDGILWCIPDVERIALLKGNEEGRASHGLGKVEDKILFQGGGESSSGIHQETMTTFKFKTLALSILVRH
ncbi:hypothetical protein L7F22_058450 [Adiantum nelumboides]|nr:hypothetical protein [Adiantum nelumboides]